MYATIRLGSMAFDFSWQWLVPADRLAAEYLLLASRFFSPASNQRAASVANQNEDAACTASSLLVFAWRMSIVVVIVLVLAENADSDDITFLVQRISSSGVKHKVLSAIVTCLRTFGLHVFQVALDAAMKLVDLCL